MIFWVHSTLVQANNSLKQWVKEYNCCIECSKEFWESLMGNLFRNKCSSSNRFTILSRDVMDLMELMDKLNRSISRAEEERALQTAKESSNSYP